MVRFDAAEHVNDGIESYAEFCRLIKEHDPGTEPPQLVITGHTSVIDPESSRIYDKTMDLLKTRHPHLVPSVSVVCFSANDQLLNSLLSASYIVLQLSTREGFEVNASEAIYKGKPVIATKTGGIPLQVQDRKNRFLVETGDCKAVAGHLFNLWTDDGLYKKMSQFARMSVSNEVGTVGNALAWFYLADKWCNGDGVGPGRKWVNDLAREDAGKPYGKGELKLPRSI
jgi:glycosyltransferase involved in cell wall biosynthesis